MDGGSIFDVFRQTIILTIIGVIIIIVPGLLVSLLVSIFQAATQINESSLSFIPKLVVTLLILLYAGPWLSSKLIHFSEDIWSNFRFYLE